MLFFCVVLALQKLIVIKGIGQHCVRQIKKKKKKLELCWLTCIIMFKWVNKWPRYKKVMKNMHLL